ncbi:MAG: carbohydrate kinase family protein [Patescibacteria group bacterium]
MFDVVTFGSATRDIFVRSKELKIILSPEFVTGKGLAVEAGGKIYVEDLIFTTGGGGSNCAATFAKQRLKTAFAGLVGNDQGGLDIFQELNDLGVDCSLLRTTSQAPTPYSVILSLPNLPAGPGGKVKGGERSILVYEGASHLLSESDLSWGEIKKTRWFYISGLSGESANVFAPLVKFAADNKIKIALNPGKDQLTKQRGVLIKILNSVDILFVNQEEASLITGFNFKHEEAIFKRFDELVPGLAVMSKGPQGVTVGDGKKIYRAGIPESGYVDRTGSGDAFGSGFTSAIIRGETIAEAIQLGTANATSTIQQIGAKNGLLKKGDWGEWEKVQVEITEL